jgi:hypothetical protein
MTDVKMRYPDHALQRMAGMESDHSSASNNRLPAYTACRDLQTRHLHRTFGLSGRRASLVAGLIFGEVTR